MKLSPLESATRKTRTIFVRAFGSRAAPLFKGASTQNMMETISAAFTRRMSREKAADVGFHIGDWAHDAALVLALHMFPERFTREEIRQVTDFVAAGMPYHSAALATHFGYEGLARDGIREVNQQEHPTKRSSERRRAVTVSIAASRGRRR
jgi:hypothetical protein